MVFGAAGSDDVFPTRALSKFVAALTGRKAAVVVDLGPAVGANVTFLGDQLGCKLHVDNILSANETWWPLPTLAEDAEGADEKAIAARIDTIKAARCLAHGDATVDGVLCWDVFDYLDDEAGRVLANEVVRVLKPGGVTSLCHGSEERPVAGPVQYEILDDMTLRYRTIDAERPDVTVRQSRAFTQFFDRLTICNSFLLKNRMREVLFRKPPDVVAVD